MKKKNTRWAEIALVVVFIIFIILVGITYRNLSLLSQGMSQVPAVEETTEIVTEAAQ